MMHGEQCILTPGHPLAAVLQIGLPGYASMPAALAAMTRQERATYCNGHWEQEWRKLFTLEFSRWVELMMRVALLEDEIGT